MVEKCKSFPFFFDDFQNGAIYKVKGSKDILSVIH